MGQVMKAMAAGVLLVGGIGALGSTASAGEPLQGDLVVSISVNGLDAQDVLDGLTIEVWAEAPPGTFTQVDSVLCSSSNLDITGAPWSVSEDYDCTFPPQQTNQFAIGLAGIPNFWEVGGSCADGPEPIGERLDLQGGENFLYFGFPSASCDLFLNSSALLIDKVVVGGDATASDFTIQVLDDQGDPVTSGSDVADATCATDYDLAKCGAIVVPIGSGFQIGEPDVANYELTSVECDQYINASNPPSLGVAPIGDTGFSTDDGDTYCVVTNTYVPPPTTTTTTTTTTVAPTTTAAPTTLAPTTSLDAGVVTLPQTGPSSSSNTTIAAVAGLLVLLGGAMLAVRRRSA